MSHLPKEGTHGLLLKSANKRSEDFLQRGKDNHGRQVLALSKVLTELMVLDAIHPHEAKVFEVLLTHLLKDSEILLVFLISGIEKSDRANS